MSAVQLGCGPCGALARKGVGRATRATLGHLNRWGGEIVVTWDKRAGTARSEKMPWPPRRIADEFPYRRGTNHVGGGRAPRAR